MSYDISLEVFLRRNGITEEIWKQSGCDWTSLVAIARDHEAHYDHLQESAGLFAKVIQKLPRVHSVRWRVKDLEHLLAKIVRKKADGAQKYATITTENYHQLVTDLVGIRALHLFKDECIEIDAQLRAIWKPIEAPVVYIREGDQGELTERFGAQGFEIKSHPAGYRSVHYVIESRPLNRSVFAEVQVRTIFEEGWSEIDHKVRYPNFSQSQLVAYFLAIFNRLSGSADEMGGFVRGLASTLHELEGRAVRANTEKQQALEAMERTLGEMDAVKQRDREASEKISKLKSEVEKLKRSSLLGTFGTAGIPDLRGLGSNSAEQLRNSLEALTTLNTSSTELQRLINMTIPTTDFARLSDVAMPAIDFDKLSKLTSPSIDFEKLTQISTPVFNSLNRSALSLGILTDPTPKVGARISATSETRKTDPKSSADGSTPKLSGEAEMRLSSADDKVPKD
jgi:putative GTP pyrophosphokinase